MNVTTRKDVYVVFSGEIDQQTTKKIFDTIAGATLQGVTHLHLLLESYGGFVGDGIALYNVFKAAPLELILYNAGSIQSIASVAYLGARSRKASPRAAFMLHGARIVNISATAASVRATAKSMTIDDQRIRSILEEHLTLSPEEWAALDHYDLHFSAEEAVENGLAQELQDWEPPSGARIYNV